MTTSATSGSSGPPLPARIGAYEVHGLAGRGGMGAVYRVTDSATGTTYALKVLESLGAEPDETASPSGSPRPSDGSGARKLPTRLRRFLREGRALAQVDQHPHVGRIHAAGTMTDGRPYLVLEWLGGGALSDLIEEEAPLPPERAIAIARKLADALAWIHARGLVHRDLKPGNVLFDARGEPRITDFGLVRSARPLSTADAHSLTRSGHAVGTPFYMAPEQAAGDRDLVGPPTDIWALGVILYQLLTGELPFDAETLPELFYKIARTSPAAPSTLAPAVPKELDAICARALARPLADRYANAAELVKDLDALTRGDTVSAVERVAAARRRDARRRMMRAGALAGAAVVVIAGGVGIAWRLFPASPGPVDRPAPGPVAPATARAAFDAGDYTMANDASVDAGAVGAALAALQAEPPDATAALAVLDGAPAPGPAATILRAELCWLTGAVDEAHALLATPGVDGSPAALALRARWLVDRGDGPGADAARARARAAAEPLGLGATVDRIAAGTDGARRVLLARCAPAAMLAARTGRDDTDAEARRVLAAASARDRESGLPALARALAAFERHDDARAIDEAGVALEARLAAPERARALMLRARARLASGSTASAAADARAAAEAGADALDAALLEVEALVVGRDAGALARAEEALARAEQAPGAPPRPWQARVWRAQMLRALALAASDRLDLAIEIADAQEKDWQRARAARTDIGRFENTEATVAKDPDDDAARFIRGRLRLQAGPDAATTWRAGIHDVVRVADAFAPAILAWRGYHDVAAGISMRARLPELLAAAEPDPLPPDALALARAVEAIASPPGTPTDRARAALAPVDRSLALEPLRASAWLVRGYALVSLGQRAAAGRAFDIAQRLAPDAGEIAAYRVLCESGRGTGGRAVDRLLILGADRTFLDRLLTDAALRESIDPSATERLRAMAPRLEAIEAFEKILPWIPRDRGDEEARAALEALSTADAGDDALLWHFAGTAGIVRAEMAREANDADGARALFARAAAAFERAMETAPASDLAPIHRAAAAHAGLSAGRSDERLLALLGEAIEHAARTMPRGRMPFTLAGLEDTYVFDLNRLHLLAHSVTGLRGLRAYARLAAGDLAGARDDAERAALDDPAQALVLAQVYRSLRERGAGGR